MIYQKQQGKTLDVADMATGGEIAITGQIGQFRIIAVAQTTADQVLSLPAPTDVSERIAIDVLNTGSASFDLQANGFTQEVAIGHATHAIWDGAAWSIVGRPEISQFTIDGCDDNQGLIAEEGLTFQMTGYTVENGPLTWAIAATAGDVANVTIDAAGLVTYDIPNVFVNVGNGTILVSATDTRGLTVQKLICTRAKDPVVIEPLAFDSDVSDDGYPLNLLAVPSSDRVFQDLGKTTASGDGDPVAVLEDSTGNGDLTTWTNATGPQTVNGPQYIASSVQYNDNPVLAFDAANSEALGIVTGNGSGAFSLVALVSSTAGDTNASVISATPESALGANGVSVESWQLSRDGTDDGFVFRANEDFASKDFAPNDDVTSNLREVRFSTWNEFADGNPHLIVVDYDGTQINGYMDGTLRFTVTAGGPLTGNQFRVGVNRGSNSFIDMQMAEMIIADATITEQQLIELQAYILAKHGLDASNVAPFGPFQLSFDVFDDVSRFEKHTFSREVTIVLADTTSSTGTEFVYDTLNQEYYTTDNVPTPGLGILRNTTIDAVIAEVGGSTAAANLHRYFVRGVSADMNFPNDGVHLLDIDLSGLVDGVDQVARERDPEGMRVGSSITIQNAGAYRIQAQANHSQNNESGTSGQNAYPSELGYRINGGTFVVIGQETDTNEADGEINGFEVLDLAAGDVLTFGIRADDNRQDEDYIIILDVEQLPTTQSVPSPTATLVYQEIFKTANQTTTNTDTADVTDLTYTVAQSGRYEISYTLQVIMGNLAGNAIDFWIADGSDNELGGRARFQYNAGDTGTFGEQIYATAILNLTAGDVVKVRVQDLSPGSNATIATTLNQTKMIVRQLPATESVPVAGEATLNEVIRRVFANPVSAGYQTLGLSGAEVVSGTMSVGNAGGDDDYIVLQAGETYTIEVEYSTNLNQQFQFVDLNAGGAVLTFTNALTHTSEGIPGLNRVLVASYTVGATDEWFAVQSRYVSGSGNANAFVKVRQV